MVWCSPSYLLACLRPGAGHRSNGKASSLNEPPHPKGRGGFFFAELDGAPNVATSTDKRGEETHLPESKRRSVEANRRAADLGSALARGRGHRLRISGRGDHAHL